MSRLSFANGDNQNFVAAPCEGKPVSLVAVAAVSKEQLWPGQPQLKQDIILLNGSECGVDKNSFGFSRVFPSPRAIPRERADETPVYKLPWIPSIRQPSLCQDIFNLASHEHLFNDYSC